MASVVIDRSEAKRYYNDIGQHHREDGPAASLKNGNMVWYFRGRLERSNGPVLDRPNGHKRWRKNGNYEWPKV